MPTTLSMQIFHNLVEVFVYIKIIQYNHRSTGRNTENEANSKYLLKNILRVALLVARHHNQFTIFPLIVSYRFLFSLYNVFLCRKLLGEDMKSGSGFFKQPSNLEKKTAKITHVAMFV